MAYECDRPGFALPLVLFLILFGSLAAMAAASGALRQAVGSGGLNASIHAIHAAESGAALIVNGYATGTYAWPQADGEYESDSITVVNPDLPIGAPGQPSGTAGRWWVERLDFQGNILTMRLVGTDIRQRAVRRLQVLYDRGGTQPVLPFDAAVIGCSGVTLGGSGAVDSYDSDDGPYRWWNAGDLGDVATLDGDVFLPGATSISGNLHVGGSITYTGSAGVSGMVQATEDVDFNGNPRCPSNLVQAGGDIDTPGGWWCSGSRHFLEPDADVSPPGGACDPLDVTEFVDGQLDGLRDAATSWDSGDFRGWRPDPVEIDQSTNFDDGFRTGAGNTVNFGSGTIDHLLVDGDFIMGGGTDVRFQAPDAGENGLVRVFIDGDLRLGGGSDLIIEAGAAVEIYVTGDTDIGGGLTNLNEDPTITVLQDGDTFILPSFVIYSSYDGANGVDIGGNTQLFASVYAPLTDVDVQGSGGLYGSVKGGTIDITGAGGIHYDEALSEVGIGADGGGGSPRVIGWAERF
jgi:hypothetical protein